MGVYCALRVCIMLVASAVCCAVLRLGLRVTTCAYCCSVVRVTCKNINLMHREGD